MDLYYCRGGDKTAPLIAETAQWLYGVRSDYRPYAPPRMIDYNFQAPPTPKNWGRHVALCQKFKPALALTCDFFSPDGIEQLYSQIRDLHEAGVLCVAVCPKFVGAVRYIPTECRIAISVPTDYAGFLPHAQELKGRKSHLLGGHPDQQHYCIYSRYSNCEVVSVDANIAARKAGKGQYWNGNKWVQVPAHTVPTQDLAIWTLRHTRETLNKPAMYYKMSHRLKRVMDNLF